MNELEISIKKTLSYFALFDYPLTKEELFFNLWQAPSVNHNEFLDYLANENPLWKNKQGFYFLPDQEKNIQTRNERVFINDYKMSIARKAVKKLRFVPFIKAVFVCNSVGLGNATEKSDIDFFIVAEKNKVWTVRAFSNLILRFLGLRVFGKNKINKICLSFFVDADSLDIEKFKIRKDDIHYIYWLNQMIPVYDPNNFYYKFLEKNSWTKQWLPNIQKNILCDYLLLVSDNWPSKLWRKFWQTAWSGGYGQMLEKQFADVQKLKLKKYLIGVDEANKGVSLEASVIKLHKEDSRQACYNKWINKIIF
jgi:hypothetical protein